jgi:putative membrane protein
MNSFKGTTLLLSITALTCVQAAMAQTSVTYSSDGRPSRIFRPVQGVNDRDGKFIKTAAIGNMYEIELSKIATERGTSDFTKEYSKEMLAEHSGSLEELKTIADKKGVMVPTDIPIELQRTVNHLSRLSGSQFDQEFREAQLEAHAMASNAFKTEVDLGHDEDVKGYAVKTLPEIALHYRLAQAKKTMMGATKADHGN